MNAEELYHALSEMMDNLRRVQEGRCPKCGEVREDDDCRACGHHSIYVDPQVFRYAGIIYGRE